MELELKFAELACCEPVGDLVTTQEESMETAIPEYCPDIARIVDTVGQLRLREKHPAGQQLTMGGSVVLTVLYTSEESAGLRSLSMEVPFSCQVEDKRLADCDAVCVTGRLLLAEAKAVTARKLYRRVMPEFTVSGYARRRQRLSFGAAGHPARRARGQAAVPELLTAVEEREFSFAQEVAPDGPPPEDVLMERTAARVEECRRVGSRLVLKGQAEVCVLYRGDNQELAAYRTALPFSQLLDGLDLPEGAETEARIQWASSEIRVLRTENGPALRCTVRLRVLYLDESGTPVCAERSAEVTAPAAWEPQTVRAACGLPQMQITGSTCRFMRTIPKKFTSSWCCASSVFVNSTAPEMPKPALLMSTSMWSSCFKISCTAAASVSSFVTSAMMCFMPGAPSARLDSS